MIYAGWLILYYSDSTNPVLLNFYEEAVTEM